MDLRDDDLFSVAGSLAELLGAPVTIEDENSTVLAYSGGEQAVDEARIGTILGRQVPSRFRQLLSDAGVFDRLHRESDPIYVDLEDPAITATGHRSSRERSPRRLDLGRTRRNTDGHTGIDTSIRGIRRGRENRLGA